MRGDFTRFTFDRRKHYSGIRMQQGRVQLDADWNELDDLHAYRLRTESEDFIGPSGAPRRAPGFAVGVTGDGKNLTLSPGRLYVNGILCENETEALLTEQPDLPGYELPTEDGSYLAYLETWNRHITSIEDPSLREVGLGGPDTGTRLQTVWQVRLHRVGEVGMAANAETEFPTWNTEIAPAGGRLQARVSGGVSPHLRTGLYRVEVHRFDPATGRVFVKWSRDNASAVLRWSEGSGEVLILEDTGRTGALGLAPGQWIELTDDTRELWRRPGTFVRVVQVTGQTVTLDPTSATGSLDIADFPRNPKAVRWESEGEVEVTLDGVSWLPLEDGIEVQLSAGTFRAGDYWLIPARSFHGDIEWPQEGNEPLPLPPHGVERRQARLALVELQGGAFRAREDCRFVFSSLTDLRDLAAYRSAVNAPDGAVYVDAKGNVGIGTREPAKRLEVHGDVASIAHGTRYSMVPVGAVLPFATEAPPVGWLECSGQALSREDYGDLFAVLGTRFGAGDGAMTFNLPDLRGVFIRGWDHARGLDEDPARSFGSFQADALQTHEHRFQGIPDTTSYQGHSHVDNTSGYRSAVTSWSYSWRHWGWGGFSYSFSTGSTPFPIYHYYGRTSHEYHNHGYTAKGLVKEPKAGSVSNRETRPKNIALMYCIKY